ncbi:DUF695 domain-containing protein [Pedobacter changchengzhani]|nr:DUF695 domain-containing protein [Pedobacter changchengzhani]
MLNKLFETNDEPIETNQDFWSWFVKNEKTFFKVVKERGDFEKKFFSKLSPKLAELRAGYFFLTGMVNDNTAELVFTADGAIANFVFVEELVASAPKLDGWIFTALKPALDIENVNIIMAGYEFNKENLSFYYAEDSEYPDEINLSIVNDNFNEQNRDIVTNGTYIFLDNYLGELNFASTIDNLEVIGKDKVQKELIPIEKLKDFLIWREKEFVEKYIGIKHHTENDSHNMLEGTLENGNPLLALVNSDLLKWDSKASHPWILCIEVKYSADENGLPDKKNYQLLNDLEDKILLSLKDSEGYLNIGRETAEGIREIFFACKDFRKPSKLMSEIKKSSALEIAYKIYKDKYWQSFNRFIQN